MHSKDSQVQTPGLDYKLKTPSTDSVQPSTDIGLQVQTHNSNRVVNHEPKKFQDFSRTFNDLFLNFPGPKITN